MLFRSAAGLKEGNQVTAGDVIGDMGHTGYRTTENVNNIEEVHLHYEIQLIFDESQKESDKEIWIDCYALCRLLSSNRSEVVREDNTKEWVRRFQLQEKSPVGQTTSPPSVATKSPSSFSGSQ